MSLLRTRLARSFTSVYSYRYSSRTQASQRTVHVSVRVRVKCCGRKARFIRWMRLLLPSIRNHPWQCISKQLGIVRGGGSRQEKTPLLGKGLGAVGHRILDLGHWILGHWDMRRMLFAYPRSNVAKMPTELYHVAEGGGRRLRQAGGCVVRYYDDKICSFGGPTSPTRTYNLQV